MGEGKRKGGRLVHEPIRLHRKTTRDTRMDINDFFSYPNKSFENCSRSILNGKEVEPELVQVNNPLSSTFLSQYSLCTIVKPS